LSHNCEFSSKSMIVVDFRIFSDARQLSVTQEELSKSHMLLVTIENWRFIVHVWEMWPIAAQKSTTHICEILTHFCPVYTPLH
jgi:hypothetical protein